MGDNGLPDGVWIDRQNTLQDFWDATAHAPWLVIDTEFLRVHTYHPKLCLIQISDGTRHALIDAQAGLDLSALTNHLSNPASISVFHACLQDAEIIHYNFGLIPRSVFDSQIAWALLGYGFQISYAAMVEKKLGITLNKSQVRSRWDRRPLSSAQLHYALSDVVHLAPIYQQLAEELEALGRLGWMYEELERILIPETWIPDPDQIWRRVKFSAGRFPADQLHVLQGLARWRELTAQKRDRARPKIIRDDALVALASTPPATWESFKRSVGDSISKKFQDELWTVLRQYQDHPPATLETIKTVSRAERLELRKKVQCLSATVREIAESLNIVPELLAPRSMLEELAQQRPNPSLLQGWRRETVGLALQSTLHAL